MGSRTHPAPSRPADPPSGLVSVSRRSSVASRRSSVASRRSSGVAPPAAPARTPGRILARRDVQQGELDVDRQVMASLLFSPAAAVTDSARLPDSFLEEEEDEYEEFDGETDDDDGHGCNKDDGGSEIGASDADPFDSAAATLPACISTEAAPLTSSSATAVAAVMDQFTPISRHLFASMRSSRASSPQSHRGMSGMPLLWSHYLRSHLGPPPPPRSKKELAAARGPGMYTLPDPAPRNNPGGVGFHSRTPRLADPRAGTPAALGPGAYAVGEFGGAGESEDVPWLARVQSRMGRAMTRPADQVERRLASEVLSAPADSAQTNGNDKSLPSLVPPRRLGLPRITPSTAPVSPRKPPRSPKTGVNPYDRAFFTPARPRAAMRKSSQPAVPSSRAPEVVIVAFESDTATAGSRRAGALSWANAPPPALSVRWSPEAMGAGAEPNSRLRSATPARPTITPPAASLLVPGAVPKLIVPHVS
ncbi:hypothetical protein AMAG_07646 [Allomyces macrogynus ATCC 38327]|uniref:Uncharacterized protein n=1 Tax=Allomyces macrogynus (strain ATCC 38327) TaxID=578462 RepID=A0A0L0SIW8_ALLM3|nr:hypothetical protein AMAG_07646 [Allomyces macrogynus ATCC 38327]|eukprot:KNE62427.1 hypothetical protein AMAG_07646 [Allomyces macrogynus ATCC 38327]